MYVCKTEETFTLTIGPAGAGVVVYTIGAAVVVCMVMSNPFIISADYQWQCGGV
jgi:hypothetical protein